MSQAFASAAERFKYAKDASVREIQEATVDQLAELSMATFGYVYLVTSNVFDEPHGWERIKDMCRKLKSFAPGDDRGGYDASCLIVLDSTGARQLSLSSSFW